MKRPIIRPIALYATQEEIRQFELIKAFHNRTSNSDMLRILIKNEAEKILSKNNHTGIITQEAAAHAN